MARSRQLGLRLDESDDMNLKRIAQSEGRTEQDILRDSLRMYVRSVDEQKAFIDSVERVGTNFDRVLVRSWRRTMIFSIPSEKS